MCIYVYVYITIYGNCCHGSSDVDHHLHHTSERTRSSPYPILFLYMAPHLKINTIMFLTQDKMNE